jgi:transcriptional regulator with XRE-family HTH domain
MKLGEKLKHLRSLEGARRGLDREMTQTEVSRLMKEELGETVTQAYLSQIEHGTRRHLTGDTRERLAKFFHVHPGYLVDDPVGYEVEIPADPLHAERTIDGWLNEGAVRFKDDPELSQALLTLSRRKDTRNCLILIGQLLETAGPTVQAPAAGRKKARSRRSR